MSISSEQSLNSIKIHKVPSFEVWGEQYGETNGIGENDIVIMSPESWKKDFQGKVYTIGIGSDNDIVIPQNYQVDFSTTYSEYITQNTVFVLKNNSENWTFTLPQILESSNPNFGREITFICNDGLGEHTVSIKGYGNIGSGVGQFDIFIPISTDSSTYQLTQNNICLKIKEVECEENFLGTDRTRGSWAILRTSDIPSQSDNSGKFLTTDGTNTSWGVPVPPWGSTISTNRTLSEADNGKAFACITNDLTITIPFSPEPQFSSGFEVEIVNWGGHNITITPAPAPTEGETGVTINNSSNSIYLNERYTSIKLKLINRGNRTWTIISSMMATCFKVEILYDSNATYKYSFNKTFAQIKAAIEMGRPIRCKYSNQYCQLAQLRTGYLEFKSFFEDLGGTPVANQNYMWRAILNSDNEVKIIKDQIAISSRTIVQDYPS